MVSRKRVILAHGSRLLREMLHRVIDKANQLEVVQEVPSWEELPSALKRFDPEWVIVTQPYSSPSHERIDSWMEAYPSVRFIFLSANQNRIKMKWQAACEEEYSDLSLKEFIHILEKDLQHI
jgi:DNA-binding NarL/FixJ family response regulator